MSEVLGQPFDIPGESELFARFSSRIRLYGLRHLRDADAADDLVQEVLIVALEKLRAGAVRDVARLPSFVLGTCRMLVMNERRGQRRRQALLDAHPEEAAPPKPLGSDPLDVEQLGRCLAALDERARTLLLLTFYADRSSEEVAEELRTSVGNVRVVRHRSMEKLRACLGGGTQS